MTYSTSVLQAIAADRLAALRRSASPTHRRLPDTDDLSVRRRQRRPSPWSRQRTA